NKILEFGKRAQNANVLLNFLYQKPIIAISDIVEPLGISKQTANSLIRDFVNKSILVEETGFQRNQIFIFKKYLDIYSQS
ncbi:MAG: hypothetical protein RLZZ293_1223, partial [Pseudomonadota bacterium]